MSPRASFSSGAGVMGNPQLPYFNGILCRISTIGYMRGIKYAVSLVMSSRPWDLAPPLFNFFDLFATI